jgi:outer membrane protein OmpA-like peptidoglycan-associated protein
MTNSLDIFASSNFRAGARAINRCYRGALNKIKGTCPQPTVSSSALGEGNQAVLFKKHALLMQLGVVFTLTLGTPAYASQPDPVMLSKIAALRERVVKATDTQQIDRVYLAIKAQRWLDFIQEETIELDDTGVTEDALQRVYQIIGWLENKQVEGKPIPATLRGTSRLHDDLWQRLEIAQQNRKNYPCAAPHLAKVEVELVWAAHEQPELGTRHASLPLQEAHDLLARAECCVVAVPPVVETPPVVTPPVSAVVETPPTLPVVDVPPTPPAPIVPTQIDVPIAVDKIPDVVHFAFDRYNISPESDKVLKLVAKTLHAYPWLKLELGGHTDRRGKQGYNMKLSQRRVTAVYNRLIELGLPADRFITRAHGMTQLMMKTDDKLARSLDRRVELIITNPNDPAAVIKVHSESQKEDLQQ